MFSLCRLIKSEVSLNRFAAMMLGFDVVFEHLDTIFMECLHGFAFTYI